MTDAQHIFDVARQHFDSLTADLESHFDNIASTLRSALPTTTPPPPPPRALPPTTTLQHLHRYIRTHRALTAALAAFLLTGTVSTLVYSSTLRSRRRRRARKAPSGARTDVVVVVPGTASSPLASALYLDLERRGFVVYVVVASAEEERYVRAQGRVDLLPLRLNLAEEGEARAQVGRLEAVLSGEQRAFEGAEGHWMRFVGVVVVPEVDVGGGRAVEDVGAAEWQRAFGGSALGAVAATRAFVPMLRQRGGKLLLLMPSVQAALAAPGHALGNTVCGALRAFAASVAADLRGSGVSVAEFRLGALDVPALTAKQRREGAPKPAFRPTPVRRLHDAVFDALVAKRPARTWYVGRGSLAYEVVGQWVPAGVVGWMMGAGRQRRSGFVEEVGEEEATLSARGSQASLTWEKVDSEE